MVLGLQVGNLFDHGLYRNSLPLLLILPGATVPNGGSVTDRLCDSCPYGLRGINSCLRHVFPLRCMYFVCDIL
jgi:hypothetical protein